MGQIKNIKLHIVTDIKYTITGITHTNMATSQLVVLILLQSLFVYTTGEHGRIGVTCPNDSCNLSYTIKFNIVYDTVPSVQLQTIGTYHLADPLRGHVEQGLPPDQLQVAALGITEEGFIMVANVSRSMAKTFIQWNAVASVSL